MLCSAITIALGFALLASGCGDGEEEKPESGSFIEDVLGSEPTGKYVEPGPVPDHSPVLYSCQGLPFPQSVFDEPPGVEHDDSPWAEGLREQIRYDRKPELQSRNEWRLLAKGDDRALFAKGAPPTLQTIEMEVQGDGSWGFATSGGCSPRAYRENAETAGWILNPSRPPPDPESTELPIVVMDSQCASGESPKDRLLEPKIEYGVDAVVVTYWTQVAFTATCPGHSPALASLSLDEPLGDRVLIDGGSLPSKRRFPDPVFDRQDKSDFQGVDAEDSRSTIALPPPTGDAALDRALKALGSSPSAKCEIASNLLLFSGSLDPNLDEARSQCPLSGVPPSFTRGRVISRTDGQAIVAFTSELPRKPPMYLGFVRSGTRWLLDGFSEKRASAAPRSGPLRPVVDGLELAAFLETFPFRLAIQGATCEGSGRRFSCNVWGLSTRDQPYVTMRDQRFTVHPDGQVTAMLDQRLEGNGFTGPRRVRVCCLHPQR